MTLKELLDIIPYDYDSEALDEHELFILNEDGVKLDITSAKIEYNNEGRKSAIINVV